MSDEIPIDKRFAILCQISRAQHFAWRKAVTQVAPEIDATEVVRAMWKVTGEDTAKAYIKHLDPSRPLPAQIAKGIVWSSQCMGEDAVMEGDDDGDEAFVRHLDCPWVHWHRREDVLAEDQPGCDAWFQSTIDEINAALGSELRFETIESLPEGGRCCLRRIWVD